MWMCHVDLTRSAINMCVVSSLLFLELSNLAVTSVDETLRRRVTGSEVTCNAEGRCRMASVGVLPSAFHPARYEKIE